MWTIRLFKACPHMNELVQRVTSFSTHGIKGFDHNTHQRTYIMMCRACLRARFQFTCVGRSAFPPGSRAPPPPHHCRGRTIARDFMVFGFMCTRPQRLWCVRSSTRTHVFILILVNIIGFKCACTRCSRIVEENGLARERPLRDVRDVVMAVVVVVVATATAVIPTIKPHAAKRGERVSHDPYVHTYTRAVVCDDGGRRQRMAMGPSRTPP